MTNNNTSVSSAGSMLLGSGLTLITTDTRLGLLLIGVGTVLKLIVAVLEKNGMTVGAHQ